MITGCTAMNERNKDSALRTHSVVQMDIQVFARGLPDFNRL